ncbi:hypothetical protein C2W62_28845 [Candidatus Entotheonella serta]|nr:hypothetical protein C2W62_28845 [Candidatus Entotheonella serta]
MRPLSSYFAHDALPTLDNFMKQTKKARVFRRTQAVREVVAGQTIKAVCETFHFTKGVENYYVSHPL